ncbi:aminodeoxychorismate synthase component I [Alloalcanivorax venustensis]|uniref:aminodeoxychorismate synthase component I n=2 Tax=Alloalcanivorax venustensis TaxID=172371 RepID=UPI0032967F1A
MTRNGGLQALGPPALTLRADSAADIEALPARVEQALAEGCRFACGLLPYEAGALLMGLPDAPERAAVTVHLFDHPPGPLPEEQAPFQLRREFEAQQSAAEYLRALARIQHYLRAGDCYQVNYAQRFQARWDGDPLGGFQRLVAAHPAPHACFFRDGDDAVFGVSPERFLSIDGRQVVTEPIKGSRPRGATAVEDQALGRALLRHPKDRAENLMIVDLLRNDLGRFCEAGSIQADPLFELRRFSNVQHLVSTVRGRLRDGVAPLAALISAFPGGSITGAPKKRAMQIIQELEPAPRGAYCGSLFWQDDQGHFDSNILIRTLQTDGDRLYCHGGGGIVFDSDPDDEYAESWFKVRKLMRSVNS